MLPRLRQEISENVEKNSIFFLKIKSETLNTNISRNNKDGELVDPSLDIRSKNRHFEKKNSTRVPLLGNSRI